MRAREIALWIVAAMLAGSCAPADHVRQQQRSPTVRGSDTMIVMRLAEPLRVDGRLDEEVWEQATKYPLIRRAHSATDRAGESTDEPGTVRLVWDDKWLYAGFEFVDRDVVQENDQDQQHHYITGDVAELFLKPVGANHYWEFYAAPNGCKTAFFFPSRGRAGLPSSMLYKTGARVAAHVDGTLNDCRDEDRGWTAELAVPLEELAAVGIPFDSDQLWTILVGRYNYGVQLSNPELSSIPDTSPGTFHSYEFYAAVRLQPRASR